jgi:hypothetical protein
MKMGHSFAAIRAVIDYQSKAGFVQSFRLRYDLRNAEEMAEQRLVAELGGRHAGDFLLWDDEEMHGRLRLDIVERQAAIVLERDLGRDFAGDDLGENRAHLHGLAAKERKEHKDIRGETCYQTTKCSLSIPGWNNLQLSPETLSGKTSS